MIDNEPLNHMVNREGDVAYVMDCLREAECCAVIGVSNIGKSVLMRALSSAEVQERHLGSKAPDFLFVYVDLNLASQVTEQGFYEATLRNVRQALAARPVDQDLKETIQEAYKTIIASSNPFLIPLAFEDSIQAMSTRQPARLVFLFDEFDEVFTDVNSRVFVRLRALKDRYWANLCYVTAAGRPLSDLQHDRAAGEFWELFAAHVRYLQPLSEADSRLLIRNCAARYGVGFSEDDVAFVTEAAGGHPALLEATSRILTRAREEAAWRPVSAGYEHVLERLNGDTHIRLECAKLWNDLSAVEQEAMMALLTGHDAASGIDTLVEKGIVRQAVDGREVFSGLLAGFARRQQLVRRRGPQGIRIDVEAGDVWVDGNLAPLLTDLEYKLLLLLYGNLDKICDKYKIVESVWGENYIDEVDDARIEKLVSRLREKLEPNLTEPKYILTIRGRGYKLVGPE
jgi:hypothetical protein